MNDTPPATVPPPAATAAPASEAMVGEMRRIVQRSARRWKRLLLLEGAALAVAVPLAYLWLAFLLDNLLHLPKLGRLAVGVLFIGGVIYLVRSLARRWRQIHLTEDQVALAMERHSGGVQNRLINAIQITRGQGPADHADDEVRQALVQENYQRLRQIELHQAAQVRPALLRLGAAAAMVLIGCLFFTFQRTHFTNAASRFLFPLADIDPVYQTVLIVEPGNLQSPGGDVTIHVRIRGQRPSDLTILRNVKGSRSTNIVPLKGNTDTVSYTFKAVDQTMTYAVKGGDYTSPYFRIEVPSPSNLSLVRAAYRFPEYTRLGERKIESASGDLEALLNTAAKLTFVFDQPVEEAAMLVQRISAHGQTAAAGGDPAVRRVALKRESATEYSGELTFRDVLGYRLETRSGKQPVHVGPPHALRVLADGDPRLELIGLERQAEAAVEAILPLRAIASDDYGLDQVGVFARRVSAAIAAPGNGHDEAAAGAAAAADDEGWRPVEVWSGRGARELRQPLDLSAAALGAAEGERFEVALRAVDTDPLKAGRWVTGTPYTLSIGGEGVALQITYEQILLTESQLKAALAQQQGMMGLATEWIGKLDGGSEMRWDDPASLEALQAAMTQQARQQEALRQTTSRAAREMVSQAGNLRISTGMLADTEMIRIIRILENVPRREHPQAMKTALSDARLTQERTTRSLGEIVEQYVRFRQDWELANMVAFTRMLADRQASLRDDSSRHAGTPPRNGEALALSGQRRQGKVAELTALTAPAFAGMAQRIEEIEPLVAQAFAEASASLGAPELRSLMAGAAEDAGAGLWAAAADKQAQAAEALAAIHAAIKKAQAEAALLAMAALEEQAKSDADAQQEIDRLRPGSAESMLEDFHGRELTLEDILHMREVAQRGNVADPIKPEMYMMPDFGGAIQTNIQLNQDLANLSLASKPTGSMSFPNSSDREGARVKPIIQEKFDDLVGKLLEEADELDKNYERYNVNYAGGINEHGDVGKQGGDLNSTAAASATGNQKQPKNQFGGASRIGRQGARSTGAAVGDEGFNRRGRDEVQEGEERVADQEGRIKEKKTDDMQEDKSTGLGGKHVDSDDPTSFNVSDAGTFTEDVLDHMQKPKEKELIVERQDGKVDPRVAEMLRDLTSSQEQLIERVKAIKKEIQNLFLPTDQLDHLLAELESNLEALRERPGAEVFRTSQETLSRLRNTVRVFNSAYAGYQPSVVRDQIVRGRVLDQPAAQTIPGYEDAVKTYYQMLSSQ